MGAEISESAVRALGVFGLTTDDVGRDDVGPPDRARRAVRELEATLRAGEVALVTGPSGSGKSTLLRAVRARVEKRAGHVIDVDAVLAQVLGRASGWRVIDVLAPAPGEVADALASLSAAGLADAKISTRRVGALSDGERARLGIAMAMRAAGASGPLVTILIDGLAEALDDANGAAVCRTLARWVRSRKNVRVVAASVRRQVGDWLSPDRLIQAHGGQYRPQVPPQTDGDAPGIGIEVGGLPDYQRLAHLHYRTRRPATCVRVLAARAPRSANPVGVLVVSMPTLNGAWRSMAWPGDYAGAAITRREAAARINTDIRCISRLIVDPAWRGRGIGRSLVRAYLDAPLTRRTETISAMGAMCPVFRRAGMQEWCVPPPARDERLIQHVEAAGLRTWMLADVDEVVRAIQKHGFLDKALRVWAMAHGPTRALVGADVREIVRAAARSVIHRPRAYTAG